MTSECALKVTTQVKKRRFIYIDGLTTLHFLVSSRPSEVSNQVVQVHVNRLKFDLRDVHV